VVVLIRARWPEVEIILRADSGFAGEALMAWCEASGVGYVFGLAKNTRLQEAIGAELAEAKRRCEEENRPARLFKDFVYQPRESWSVPRRVIGKAEHLPPGCAESQKAYMPPRSGAAPGSAAQGRSGHLGSLLVDHQVLPQKNDLIPDDLRAHVGAVEVEVSAGIALELTTRRVIRYLARQLHR
jgi:Transposase DDE domain group 1